MVVPTVIDNKLVTYPSSQFPIRRLHGTARAHCSPDYV